MSASETKNSQVNNDTSGPSPTPRAAAAAVTAAAAAAAVHAPYVRAPEAGGHGAEGHKLPYDEHHGHGGAFVMVKGERVRVKVRHDPSTKKAIGHYVVVDGQEIDTDRDGAPIARAIGK